MNAPLHESITQARRAIASGRALFRDGLIPECQAYTVLALRSLLEAWIPVAGAASVGETPDEPEEQALAALARAQYPRLDRLRAALRWTAGQAPVTTLATSQASQRDFDRIWSEVDRLSRFTDRHFNPAETRQRFRVRLALVVVPLAILAGMFVELQLSRPQTLASASYADEYPPSHAVDGLEATEWLLPDATPGWLDLIFKAPRDIHRIRLVSAHNGAFADRGSKNVRLTAFSDKDAVASVDGAFLQANGDRAALDLPLRAKRVTRLRIDVLSYFKMGGGFAEVEVH